MLDLNRILMFLQTVESGSVSGAAENLGISPSAVSQQLKKLEKDVGIPLLERASRGAFPSEAGLLLAEHARKLAQQASAAEADMEELRTGRAGTLRIGTFPTFAASHLPSVITTFKSRFPNVDLKISSSRFQTLTRQLYEGSIQLAILWDYPWKPFEGEGLQVTQLFKERMVLVLPKQHRLVRRESFTLADLSNEKWVLRADRHPAGEVLERLAQRGGFKPKVAMLANDYNETQAMVSAGIGIGIAPASALALQHPDLVMVPLPQSPQRNVFLAQRAERNFSTLEKSFVEILQAKDYEM